MEKPTDVKGEVLESRSEGGIVRLTLSAPWRGNAVDNGMLRSLAAKLQSLQSEVKGRAPTRPRVLLLAGAGERHFCTGYHLRDLLAQVEGPQMALIQADLHPLEQAMRALADLEIPSIAMIQGHAYGAGCELAMTCDLRLASERARFCMPPTRLGVLYSATGLRRLLNLVGPARAKELIFTATAIDAPQALRIGLCEHVYGDSELEREAFRMAETVAANAPLAVSGSKKILEMLARASRLTESEYDQIQEMRRECFNSQDFRAAVRAFNEGSTAPPFRGE